MVDINQDGFLDIYVNVSGSAKFGSTANLLYINNKDGTFKEEAAKYGIADTRLTMNASFFDYDKDGDLDLFLITNPADESVGDVNTVLEIQSQGQSPGTDILYRNNGDGTFTDVSKTAGILKEGFSLGCAISDLVHEVSARMRAFIRELHLGAHPFTAPIPLLCARRVPTVEAA